jgi:hypothetical protein
MKIILGNAGLVNALKLVKAEEAVYMPTPTKLK